MFEFLKKKISNFKEKLKEKIFSKEKELSESELQRQITKEDLLFEEQKIVTSDLQNKLDETGLQKEEITKQPVKIFVKDEFRESEKAKETTDKEQKFEKLKVEDKREIKAKVSLETRVKSIISSKIKISEKDIEDLLLDLELSLLEADVEQNTASEIVNSLKKDLVGKEVDKNTDISEFLKNEIKKCLFNIMDVKKPNIFNEASNQKPYVILFLGPNGAGKTTTIAKLTNLFMKRGKRVIWAASDTFRAASIEQLEEHAKKLNIRLIKHNYGSDPAAVAYDAIEAAKSHGIDIVMIDSAGRQETNKNLIEELKKIIRVSKPNLKVFVAESYAGQNLLNQIREFDKHLTIDAFILTKVDADAKGGTAISILHSIKKPILFIGIGQSYDDLIDFEPSFILDRIL
ncbi:MAG: signal recognition particle-docking protein FtsY [Candidatus Diapherotrites archaeon]|nr:signal recognition particle-docking protein FtsY [Candidatus Diapherotrites archaeon]